MLDATTSQRDQLGAWERALEASGLPVAGLDAIPPKPRFAVAAPLGAGIAGEAELVDVWLTAREPVWRVREALGASMPPGHRLLDLHDVWLGEAALPGRVVSSVFRATFDPGSIDAGELRRACAALLAASAIPRDRAKGDGTVRYDLRPFIEGLVVDDGPPTVRMTLRHDPERGVGRPDEVLAALAGELRTSLTTRSLVRERLVLAQPSAAAAAATRVEGRGRTSRGGPRAR